MCSLFRHGSNQLYNVGVSCRAPAGRGTIHRKTKSSIAKSCFNYKGQQPAFNIQHSTFNIFKQSMPLIVGLMLLLLSACTITQPSSVTSTQLPSDKLPPDIVVQGFFSDLGAALRDPNLGQEDTRSMWVDRLAGYFAPNEQYEQRVTLNDSLTNFANDRAQLGKDETLTIEINLGSKKQTSESGNRALVKYPDAKLFIQLARITENGIVPYYEQPIEIARLTGRSDQSIPTVLINNRWYLTSEEAAQP